MNQKALPHQARAWTLRFSTQEESNNVPSTAESNTKATVSVAGSRTIEAAAWSSARRPQSNPHGPSHGGMNACAISHLSRDVQNSALRRIRRTGKESAGNEGMAGAFFPHRASERENFMGMYHRHGVQSTAAIAGHPLHHMLIVFPVAFLIGALGTDIAFLAVQDPFWAQVSYWLLIAGIVTALVAAVPGLIDF